MSDDKNDKDRPILQDRTRRSHEWLCKRRTLVADYMDYLVRVRRKSDADSSEYKPLTCEELPASRGVIENNDVDDLLHDLSIVENDVRQRSLRFQMTEPEPELVSLARKRTDADQEPKKSSRKPQP